jgi:hypothetical protein
LNLTNEDKNELEDDPAINAKLQAEYEKFMSEMKNNMMDGDEGLDGLNDALGGLLKNLGDSLGFDGVIFRLFRKKGSSLRTYLEEVRPIWKIWLDDCYKSS